jgi:hypothetical protein
MRRFAICSLVVAGVLGACGASATPAPTARGGAPATPVASQASGGSGEVKVTYGGKTVTLTGAACVDSKKMGVDVRAGGNDFTKDGPDGIIMLIPHDGSAPTIVGLIGNKAFTLTGDAKGTVGADLSGTFSGKDQNGVTVEGTFRCA